MGNNVAPASRNSGFDTLRFAQTETLRQDPTPLATEIHPAFVRYHRIHKVLVGPSGGEELESIHYALQDTTYPMHLHAAGWAAAEAALALTDRSASYRNQLMEQAKRNWEEALETQLSLHHDPEREWLLEDSEPYRLALDIAHAPLMQAIVAGNVTKKIKYDVIADTLRIAQAAQVQLELARQRGDMHAVSDLSGFGYECNSLILLNLITDSRGVAVPSSPRAGSGHNYPHQTHDISYIIQHWGTIRKVLPVEIKSKASAHARTRYDALLVRGKMHLSMPGRYIPRETLDILTRIFEGRAKKSDIASYEHISANIINLIKLYKRGQVLGTAATNRTVTDFHDDRFVSHLYTEKSVPVA